MIGFVRYAVWAKICLMRYKEILNIMKKYICTKCKWIYDPKIGDSDGGIAPGTDFKNIPDDWVCPICGATKDKFIELVE